MEIQDSSLPGFYLSRVLGMAPYLIKKNDKNRVNDIRRSTWLCLYSICFMTATVSMTVRFIFVDADSKTPIRMRTATSKFVTVFDVCVVVGACVCGAITGLIGRKWISRINDNLRKADDELTLFNDQWKDKKRNLIMVVLVFLSMTGMIVLDIISKWRSAKNLQIKMTKGGQATSDIRIETYFPFYVLYYILMALHTQLAQTALGIQRRYHRLNLAIRNIFSLKKLLESASHAKANKVDVQNTTEPAPTMETNENILPGSNINVPVKPIAKITTLSRAPSDENHIAPIFGKLTGAVALTRASFFLDRLSYTHAILGETVTIISRVFGLTLLVMLASCLLHLVATSYFLFFELLNEPDMFVASLQLLWCCFHLSRLLLIVEPCHMATTEARKTIIIVCEVLRNCKDSSVEPILQRFWRQLLADRTFYFTACGMCTIDRQILTSISGAIATYLVILIQFQKSDG
ncbi:gustatory receptor for sugar taste 43a-like isoform X2 [Sitodiplosis mosellana]|uniref:gustatory receptor for sugar taste 43a-like isoform X2 n=1 Tax=Sitodiplosis mosellana TaxID=263140 RepID=UPI002443ADFC|nr:gustatory receptor for sugar taste 43a-like isoform X2 [Sitodiplosis mosellana]